MLHFLLYICCQNLFLTFFTCQATDWIYVPTFSIQADFQTSRFAPAAGQLEICSIGMCEICYTLPVKMPIPTLLNRNKDIKLTLQHAQSLYLPTLVVICICTHYWLYSTLKSPLRIFNGKCTTILIYRTEKTEKWGLFRKRTSPNSEGKLDWWKIPSPRSDDAGRKVSPAGRDSF